MNLQKKIICLMIILLILIGMCNSVFAFDLLANVNQEKLQQKELQVSLQVSDLDLNPEGINAVSGKIVFDPDIIEKINFTGINNWSVAYNDEKGNENEGKFILITTAGSVTQTTNIANVEFVLKDNVNNTKTQIKVEQIQTSYESKKIEVEDKIINLEIKDNEIKIIEDKLNTSSTNEFKIYPILILIAIIAILIILVFMIKSKEKRTNEK